MRVSWKCRVVAVALMSMSSGCDGVVASVWVRPHRRHTGCAASLDPTDRPAQNLYFWPVRHGSRFRTLGPVRRVLEWLQSEPAAENPPVRVWRDWLLIATVAASTVVEVAVRDQLVWRLAAVAFGIAMAFALLSRRTQPLAMVLLGFGALLVIDVSSAVAASGAFYPYGGAFVVVL